MLKTVQPSLRNDPAFEENFLMDCQVRNIPLSKTAHSHTTVLFNSRGPGSSVHQQESCLLLSDLKARRAERFN